MADDRMAPAVKAKRPWVTGPALQLVLQLHAIKPGDEVMLRVEDATRDAAHRLNCKYKVRRVLAVCTDDTTNWGGREYPCACVVYYLRKYDRRHMAPHHIIAWRPAYTSTTEDQ